jgi:hypothetical protein
LCFAAEMSAPWQHWLALLGPPSVQYTVGTAKNRRRHEQTEIRKSTLLPGMPLLKWGVHLQMTTSLKWKKKKYLATTLYRNFICPLKPSILNLVRVSLSVIFLLLFLFKIKWLFKHWSFHSYIIAGGRGSVSPAQGQECTQIGVLQYIP